MLENIPSTQDMTALLGEALYSVWNELCRAIDAQYDMDRLWDKGYGEWIYEYKYRRGGKTLCTLYAKEHMIGVQIIFGKDERAKVEAIRCELSAQALKVYDEAHVYHDGKWVMFTPDDTSLFGDFLTLLKIKRKPNRK